jgi:hypothetical protein
MLPSNCLIRGAVLVLVPMVRRRFVEQGVSLATASGSPCRLHRIGHVKPRCCTVVTVVTTVTETSKRRKEEQPSQEQVAITRPSNQHQHETIKQPKSIRLRSAISTSHKQHNNNNFSTNDIDKTNVYRKCQVQILNSSRQRRE